MQIKLISKKEQELNREIVRDFNSEFGQNVTDINYVLDFLSKKFSDNYKYVSDAQDAFDTLVDEYSNFMNKYPFIYSLSGDETWKVSTGSNFKESNLNEYLKVVNKAYPGLEATTLDDALSRIEHDVKKTMSNAGCDMFTALYLILSEDLSEFCNESIFAIIGADSEPRIELLY